MSRPAKKHCGGGGRKRWGEGKSEVEGRLEVRRKTRRELERKRQEDWPKERWCVGWRGGGKDDSKEGGREKQSKEVWERKGRRVYQRERGRSKLRG